MSDGSLHYKAELKQTLRFWDLVVYGMVFMLPIAPFALFGIIGHAAHGMVVLAYIFGAIVMAFTARSYGVLSAEFPIAGSVYTYAREGLNETCGFFAGWLIFLDYVILPGLMYVIAGAAFNALFPAVDRWLWIIFFVILGTSANYFAINITARVNKILLFIMFIVLAIFLIVAIKALSGGAGNGHLTFAALYNQSEFSWATMGTAVLISSTNFLGFDAITTLAEEVVPEQRHLLGRAGVTTLVLIAIMFCAQSWLASDLLPGTKVQSPDTAFYDISRYIGGDWLYTLTSVSTALAFGIACAVVGQAAISRILFAMGRDRQLPAIFAKVHPVTQQPYIANLFVGMVSLIIGLFFRNRIDDLVLFENFGALSAFTLVNLSVIGHFYIKQGSRKIISHLVLPLVGATTTIVLLLSMRSATVEMGLSWLVLGVIYYIVLRVIMGRQLAMQV